jgi:hypothetical protein
MSKVMRHVVLGVRLCMSLTSCQSATLMDNAQTIMNSPLTRDLGGMIGQSAVYSLSNSEVSAGLKEALRIGSSTVVSQLGRSGGFSLNDAIRIALPDELQGVDKALSMVGMNSLTADLENRLNAAAEIATPKARALFVNAISNMTIEDGYNILTGPQDAATTYLRNVTGAQLTSDMMPLIQSALSQAGAVRAYDQVMGQYAALPFMPDVKANLNNYVAEKTLDGIFYYVAQEELKIRTNPAARTTDLLKKVFANQ